MFSLLYFLMVSDPVDLGTERTPAPLCVTKRKRHQDDGNDTQDPLLASGPRHPTSSKRRRLSDSHPQTPPPGNKRTKPVRTTSAPSALRNISSSQVPYLIPDAAKVADLRRSSDPTGVGLGQYVHQFGDCMLPPLTQAELDALRVECGSPSTTNPVPVSSTPSSMNIFATPPIDFFNDPTVGLSLSSTTMSSSPAESTQNIFEHPLEVQHFSAVASGSESFPPQFTLQLQSQSHAQASQQQRLFDMSLIDTTFPTNPAAYPSQPQPQLHPQYYHTPQPEYPQPNYPQAYGPIFVPSLGDFTASAAPGLYKSLMHQSDLDSQIQEHQQLPVPTSSSDIFSLSNAELSSIARITFNVDANDALGWTASTPPFGTPSTFDVYSRGGSTPSTESGAAGSRNVSASSSFSLDSGSVGAVRRSHSPQSGSGAGHPYALNGRLEALEKKRRELAEKWVEVESAEAELRLQLELGAHRDGSTEAAHEHGM